MKNILDIMKFLGVDEEMAEEVLSEMENSGLDFSECTMKEFKIAMQEAYVSVQEGDGDYGYAEQKNFD